MTDDILAVLGNRDVLTLTAIGEARGDSVEGGSSIEERLAVMLVIRNRLQIPKRFGATYRDVCLQRHQFSCWNEGDPNRAFLLALAGSPTGKLMLETGLLAEGVIDGDIQDFTHGATHYFSPRSMVPAGATPAWAVGVEPCARIGSSLYFRGV